MLKRKKDGIENLSKTTKELRYRQAFATQEEQRETINDIDYLVFTNEVTLESCDPFDNINELMGSPQSYS